MARTEKAIALQTEISAREIGNRIYTLRGCPVMLDSDLAEIYQVETRMVKRAVRRNPERFPEDFKFELTNDECELLKVEFGISNVENFSDGDPRPCLISQSGISNAERELRGRGGNRHNPFAFSELGVAMLSTVLHSPRAIQISVEIMRAFVELRKENRGHYSALMPKLDSLENMMKQRFDQLEAQFQNQAANAPSVPRLPGKRHPLTVIQDMVARYFGLSSDDIKSASRTQATSLPRQIAVYLARKHLGMSFSEIGRQFGGRDHTTILHSYRKILADAETNTMIRTSVDALGKEIHPMLT